VTLFAALALSIALENPASSANAQGQSQAQSTAKSATAPAAPAVTTSLAASNGIAPTIVATNLGIRTLSAQELINATPGASAASQTSATSPETVFLTSSDQPDRVFSLLVPSASSAALAASASAVKRLAAFAGNGEVGSIGDGGAAVSAQFDLDSGDISQRSGIAIGSDGSIYIADSGNATIRMVAGPASSEPGVIRSVAGRWGPRQNVEISQPMGIALDRAGNLYIADFGGNAIDVLYGASSPKAGQLETLAHMVAPGSVAATLDGSVVFASSPQTGTIIAINTQTRAMRTPAIDPSALFAADIQRSSASRITPTGIAVDGGGNLFIAYSNPGAAYDEILRFDGFSSKVTLAARGLSSPGDISFDAKGNLFVANQGTRNVVRFNSLGVPATGVTLTPPTSACTDNSGTIFCDQLIGGTSATQSYELTNNTANEISAIATSFTSGNSGDFTVVNSSCSATLAAGGSCAFNLAFTPTANASAFQTNDGVTCVSSATLNSRCSVFNVTYTGSTAPLATAVTGIADDFQIVCMTSATSSCVDLPDSNFDRITIAQGNFATFQMQIVPDNTFSGNVNLVCPTGLPASPTTVVGNPTTCGLSLGTSVTEPLQSSLTVPVVAGTPLVFNMTIQTTATNGTQTTPNGPVNPTPPNAKRSLSLASLIAGRGNRGGGNSSGPAATPRFSAAASLVGDSPIRFLALLLAASLFSLAGLLQRKFVRENPALAMIALALIVATVAGCGSGNKAKGSITFTPTGTYMLTVQGTAQNAGRGYTSTLIVD
jgi:sugar lactone lactonase YvrE